MTDDCEGVEEDGELSAAMSRQWGRGAVEDGGEVAEEDGALPTDMHG